MSKRDLHYHILGYALYIILLILIWNAPLWFFIIIIFSYWFLWRKFFDLLYPPPESEDYE